MALLDIAQKAMTAVQRLKDDSPEAYEYVSQHHASALAAAEAVNKL
jgi:hypothetical protein